MGAHGSGGLTKTAFKNLSNKFNANLQTYLANYKKLQNAVTAIESGANVDSGKGLWSGKNASTWVKTAKKSLNKNAKLYNALETLSYEIAYEAKIDK